MRRFVLLASILFLPLTARAQGPGLAATPLGVDLRKVPIGSWSEYKMTVGQSEMKARWSLVARDAKTTTLETGVEGAALAMMGGKMTMKLVLAPDPINAERPVQQVVMQVSGKDPMEMPQGMQMQRFTKPDPKKLVGKENITVAAGKFKASHYRDKTESGTFDYWISEDAAPLGLVKVTTVPPAGTKGPDGQPVAGMTMELTARGKGAKPTVTKTPKPFDPTMFGGAPSAAPSAGKK